METETPSPVATKPVDANKETQTKQKRVGINRPKKKIAYVPKSSSQTQTNETTNPNDSANTVNASTTTNTESEQHRRRLPPWIRNKIPKQVPTKTTDTDPVAVEQSQPTEPRPKEVEKPTIVCECGKKVVDIPVAIDMHRKGLKHQQFEKAKSAPVSEDNKAPTTPEKPKINLIRCECGTEVKGEQQLQEHRLGKKHQKFVIANTENMIKNQATEQQQTPTDATSEQKRKRKRRRSNKNANGTEVDDKELEEQEIQVEEDRAVVEEVLQQEEEEDEDEDDDDNDFDDDDDEAFIMCECGKRVRNTENALNMHKKQAAHKKLFGKASTMEKEILQSLVVPETIGILDSLSLPIQTYYNSVKPSDYEIASRERLRSRFESMIQSIWKEARLYVFGSSASNLFEPDSDIDFCLSLPDFYETTEVDAIKALAKLLKSRGVWHTLCLVKARVPILKLLSTGRVFYKTFDLCVNRNLVTQKTLKQSFKISKGMQNSRLIRAYADLDPRVRPLAMVLKKWSKTVKVYNPSSGFSSYCIYLLLIFFLQTRPQPVLPNLQSRSEEIIYLVDGYNCHFDKQPNWKSVNTESLGQLLCKFFLYFWQFDYKHYAVSVRLGKLIPKSSCKFTISPIAVEDPFETDFNCSRLIKRFTLQRITQQFKLAYHYLYTTKNVFQLLGVNPVLPQNNNNNNNKPRAPRTYNNNNNNYRARNNNANNNNTSSNNSATNVQTTQDSKIKE